MMRGILYILRILYFNTKKVRLKRPWRLRLALGPGAFQYQKGAIKTQLTMFDSHALGEFQYQKGAIKTIDTILDVVPRFTISIPKRCD